MFLILMEDSLLICMGVLLELYLTLVKKMQNTMIKS